MPEHLLHRTEVCAAFEQVCGEGMPEEVRMHPLGLQPGLRGQAAKDQEGSRAREAAALRVEEELRAVAGVQIRAPAREVTT